MHVSVLNLTYIPPLSLSARTCITNVQCQSLIEVISQGYLFWADQVGFEISPPLYRLLDPFLRVLESPGREVSIGPLREMYQYHLEALM